MIMGVKMYKDVPNPAKYPQEWPAECVEVKDGQKVPDGYAGMTMQEYKDYRKRLEPEYNDWYQNIYEPKEKQQQRLLKLIGNLEQMAESYQEMQEMGETLTTEEQRILQKYQSYKQKFEQLQ